MRQTKNFFGTFDLLLIPLLLFFSTLLTSPTIPSLLSQHPSLYSFNMYLNDYFVSLEPQTFGFPLDSCPDALPVRHRDLDASSSAYFFNYIIVHSTYISLNYSNETCILDPVHLSSKSKPGRLCWFHLVLTVMDKKCPW